MQKNTIMRWQKLMWNVLDKDGIITSSLSFDKNKNVFTFYGALQLFGNTLPSSPVEWNYSQKNYWRIKQQWNA